MQKVKTDKTKALYDFDGAFGDGLICGADEAGRGPLAGPVVCAACILPRGAGYISGINDSKQVSEAERARLYTQITAAAVAYRVAVIDNTTVDRLNILGATKAGLTEAILGLSVRPDVILVDAVKNLALGREYHAIIKGDEKSYAIAAASILAKVTRDEIMRKAAQQYPEYGFQHHKGYATRAHIEAFKSFGKTPLHRETFIRKLLARMAEEGGDEQSV
ncbi:MAG: ribonuclease HII [Firmicutes bacterium]|nr:ribonuclease HII [Bacillota bacterium]